MLTGSRLVVYNRVRGAAADRWGILTILGAGGEYEGCGRLEITLPGTTQSGRWVPHRDLRGQRSGLVGVVSGCSVSRRCVWPVFGTRSYLEAEILKENASKYKYRNCKGGRRGEWRRGDGGGWLGGRKAPQSGSGAMIPRDAHTNGRRGPCVSDV